MDFLWPFQHVLFFASWLHATYLGFRFILYRFYYIILHFRIFKSVVSSCFEKFKKTWYDWTWHSKRMGVRICKLCKLFLGSNGLAHICGVIISIRSIFFPCCIILPNAIMGIIKTQTLQKRFRRKIPKRTQSYDSLFDLSF